MTRDFSLNPFNPTSQPKHNASRLRLLFALIVAVALLLTASMAMAAEVYVIQVEQDLFTTHAEGWNKAVELTSASNSHVNVNLLADWTADENHCFGTGIGFGDGTGSGTGCILVPLDKYIDIDFHNHTIDRGLGGKTATSDGMVIKVLGYLSAWGDNGTITGGSNSGNGGGVYVGKGGKLSTSVFISIKGNYAKTYGGGVYVDQNGTFNMSKGSITGNNVETFGGGVYAAGTINIYPHDIDNIRDNVKDGIWDSDNKKYTGGTRNNVYLPTAVTIAPSTTADPGSVITPKVGVSVQTTPNPATPVDITTASKYDLSSFFSSDDPKFSTINSGSDDNQVVQLALNVMEVDFDTTDIVDPVIYTDFETGWNAAVGANNTEHTKVTLLADWKASKLENRSITSFGTGIGFGDGTDKGEEYILVPVNKHITLDLGTYKINRNQENISSYGMVIKVVGNLTLEGTTGTITGGKSSGNGGGVYVDGGTFTLKSGSISVNEASNGGGVYISGSGVFNMEGGSITNNSAKTNGGGVYYDSTGIFTVSGTASIQGNIVGVNANNVYLTDNQKITIAQGGLSNGASICVTSAAAASTFPVAIATAADITGNCSGYFISDNPDYGTRDSGSGTNHVVQLAPYVMEVTYAGTTPTTKKYVDFDKGWKAAVGHNSTSDKPVTVTLLAGWNADSSYSFGSGDGFGNGQTGNDKTTSGCILVPSDKTIILDLNGKTINRGLSSGSAVDYGCVINNRGTLTIESKNSSGEAGTIKGGSESRKSEGGGGVFNTGTLTLNSGTITNNYSQYNGGGVYSTSSFTMKGGSITSNEARINGGGVYTSGTFTMTGGSISGNKVGQDQEGGGVYVIGKTTNISGSPDISGNNEETTGQVNNVYLYSGYVINVTGALTGGANINVTAENKPATNDFVDIAKGNAEGNNPYTVTDSDSQCFHSDNTNYVVQYNDVVVDGVVQLAIKDEPTVIVGSQQGTLTYGDTASTATYSLKALRFNPTPTSDMCSEKWYEGYQGAEANKPEGISLAFNLNDGKITASITAEAQAGDYYFKVKAENSATTPQTATSDKITLTVGERPLTISDPNVTTKKVYDGNNKAAVVAVGTLEGLVDGDTMVDVSATATYDSKDVGKNKTITVVYTISGDDSGNYLPPANYTIHQCEITSPPSPGSTVATPTITPEGGRFINPTEVTLECATAGAAIYYTTDGSDPTSQSLKYEKPFTLTESHTVKARALLSGWYQSGVASAEFTIIEPTKPYILHLNGMREEYDSLTDALDNVVSGEKVIIPKPYEQAGDIAIPAGVVLVVADRLKLVNTNVTGDGHIEVASTGGITLDGESTPGTVKLAEGCFITLAEGFTATGKAATLLLGDDYELGRKLLEFIGSGQGVYAGYFALGDAPDDSWYIGDDGLLTSNPSANYLLLDSMVMGKGKKIKALNLLPLNFKGGVTWKSDVPAVLQIKGKGQKKYLKPVAIGAANLTATFSDGVSETITVSVVPKKDAATGLTLRNKLTMKINETKSPKAVVKPASAVDTTLKWFTTDASVATVDQAGTITAVAKGKCKIYAITTAGARQIISVKVK